MSDFILLMHTDVPAGVPVMPEAWPPYFARLREAGALDGGSAIGDGVCMSKGAADLRAVSPLSGYIRVRAKDLEAARELVIGNPVYERGGTVEIRALPRTA